MVTWGFIKVLKSGANVLLLDEPTNDLDVDTSSFEGGLEDFAGCAVVISHVGSLTELLLTCLRLRNSAVDGLKEILGI